MSNIDTFESTVGKSLVANQLVETAPLLSKKVKVVFPIGF